MRSLLVCFICLTHFALFSQSKDKKKISLDINVGTGITFHHNKLAYVFNTFDGGGTPTYQEKRYGSSFQIQGLRELNNNHYIGLNINFTEYNYFESGYTTSWGDYSGEYEVDRNFRFLGLGVLYNYSIPVNKRGKIDLGIGLRADQRNLTFKLNQLKYWFAGPGGGISTRVNVSYAHLLLEDLYIKAGGYYITAIGSYFEKDYYPYSYGVFFGLEFDL